MIAAIFALWFAFFAAKANHFYKVQTIESNKFLQFDY